MVNVYATSSWQIVSKAFYNKYQAESCDLYLQLWVHHFPPKRHFQTQRESRVKRVKYAFQQEWCWLCWHHIQYVLQSLMGKYLYEGSNHLRMAHKSMRIPSSSDKNVRKVTERVGWIWGELVTRVASPALAHQFFWGRSYVLEDRKLLTIKSIQWRLGCFPLLTVG